MTLSKMQHEILEHLATRDNLKRLTCIQKEMDYYALGNELSDDDSENFFTSIWDLHTKYLIDAMFTNDELVKNPGNPKIGKLKIRLEGIEYLKQEDLA